MSSLLIIVFFDLSLFTLTKPCSIRAVATGTMKSSFGKEDLILSFRVLLADTSCDLEMNFVLIAIKATAMITLAVKAERAFPLAAVFLSVTKKREKFQSEN